MFLSFEILILTSVALAVYFLPWLCAASQNHPYRSAIFILNLFAGWTFFGWVGALVWAHVIPKGSSQKPVWEAPLLSLGAKLAKLEGEI